MPVFFQQKVDETTRIGIWKIEENEEFFKGNVPQHRDVTHPHKRLQHLAGRFLLQFLYPDFPYELIQIADTRKPYLPDERYHFSISHCGDYAAAIVSPVHRVGIDIEIPTEKIRLIMHKFLNPREHERYKLMRNDETVAHRATLLWSAKEAVFKWYGNGGVDFRQHILLGERDENGSAIDCDFAKTGDRLSVNYRVFDSLMLAWVVS